LGVDLCGTTILPLHFAAEEAWMSIEPRHGTAARWQFSMTLNSLVWAAALERER